MTREQIEALIKDRCIEYLNNPENRIKDSDDVVDIKNKIMTKACAQSIIKIIETGKID